MPSRSFIAGQLRSASFEDEELMSRFVEGDSKDTLRDAADDADEVECEVLRRSDTSWRRIPVVVAVVDCCIVASPPPPRRRVGMLLAGKPPYTRPRRRDMSVERPAGYLSPLPRRGRWAVLSSCFPAPHTPPRSPLCGGVGRRETRRKARRRHRPRRPGAGGVVARAVRPGDRRG